MSERLHINNRIYVLHSEIDFKAIRASGPGGQNVNKVSSAIHLRFDVKQSSLLDGYKSRIFSFSDQRISSDGVIIIKAQSSRLQSRNKEIALERLQELLKKIFTDKPKRRPTRPTRGSKERRLKKKSERSAIKSGRGKVKWD